MRAFWSIYAPLLLGSPIGAGAQQVDRSLATSDHDPASAVQKPEPLALIVHEPTRVEVATERSVAHCRKLEVSIERPLTSKASRTANIASIAINGRNIDDAAVRPFLVWLSDENSMYHFTFTCGYNGVIGVNASRAKGSPFGTPGYTRAGAWFSKAGLVQLNPPESETPENFWLR